MQGLYLTGGDNLPDGEGGGIRVAGRGRVVVSQSTITLNHAGDGGGIYFRGSGVSNSTLEIGSDTLIIRNDAVDGGGLFIQNARLEMTAPRSSIYDNYATGAGGGIRVYGAFEGLIVSGGRAGARTIALNQARVGGAISMQGDIDTETQGRLELRSVDPLQRVGVYGNTAFDDGGAFNLQPAKSFYVASQVWISAYDIDVEENSARRGAIANLSNQSSVVSTLGGNLLLQGTRLIGNASETAANVPTNEPLIVATEESSLTVLQSEFRRNLGGPLVRSGNGSVQVNDTLIADNAVTDSLLSLDGAFYVQGTTIAGNALRAGRPVIKVAGAIDLRRSLVWQPGHPVLDATTQTVQNVLASDTASLGLSNSIVSAPPRFLDPERGDYRLQAASPAVDFATAVAGDDVVAQPRGIDLARVSNLHGPDDVGAYELPAIGNLVRNPGFSDRLRFWQVPDGVNVTENAAGAFSNNSVTLSVQAAPGGQYTGMIQCVRVPGPGVWRLSGYAYGGGDALTRDLPSLRWRLIHDSGDETCGGPLGAEGNVAFPGSGTWAYASTLIDVPTALFTERTALEVQLRVTEGFNIASTTIGNFDGIALEPSSEEPPQSGLPFADGFE